MNALNLAVMASKDAGIHERMSRLAHHLGLPLVADQPLKTLNAFDAVLHESEEGLGLQLTGKGAPGPVRVDFVGGSAAHRRRFGGGKGQDIAKAVGLADAGKRQLHVLDATAGLGRDAFVLASLGCRMTLIERSDVVQALLIDGLRRAVDDPEVSAIVQNMTLAPGDALRIMAAMETADRPDVVYLDPMFPHRRKAAAVKKEMRLFQDLVGEDPDADGLLTQALALARFRVVVKRPRLAPDLAGKMPNYRLEGKSGRFDVYTLASIRQAEPA
ncbi:class I SAM-dependent methyltransferase [Kistimonas scapharcae]|uniref:Ribosomal RNA small subunit methyltransferase J n=1 Tax=Kistimonas scapharcae TaxID=1036133 RepID=A0ABP8V9J1_9GAMM